MENDLSRVVEALPGFVWAARPDGQVEFLNQAWTDYTGLGIPQSCGVGWQAAVHSDDLPRLLASWRPLQIAKTPVQAQVRVRGQDGTYRWHLFRAQPSTDMSGQGLKWCGLATEIYGQSAVQENHPIEAAPNESDDDARLVLDNIPGIVLFMTPDGELEFVNRTVTTYFGKSLAELKRWAEDDTIHPEDRPGIVEVFRRAIGSGEPYKFEGRFRSGNGTYRWFKCRGLPSRDAAGRIVRWRAVGIDIEDKKRAETLLAGEKRLLEMVANDRPLSEILESLCQHVESTTSGSACSIVLVDPSGTKLQEAIAPSLPPEFNDAVRGWPLERLGGPCQVAARDKTQVIMSDVVSDTRWRTSWRALAQKHGLRSCWSTPIVSRDGKALGTFALYQRDPGTPTPFQLDVIQQYTHIASIAIERAQRDAALRQSEARRATAERDLQEMIDTIPTLIATYRPDGSRIFVNKTWLDYTGLPPGSAMQAERSSIVHPDDTERVGREWEKSLAEGVPLKSEMRLRRADGAYRWHSVQRVCVGDESGAIVKWYSVGVDIEDRKRSEEALRQSEARLSKAERELQLTIDTIPAFVTVFRPDGEREYVNKTWRDNTGLQLSDIKNGGWRSIVHPDDQERSDRLWREAVASGQPLEIRQRIRRHDGEYRWHLGRRVPLRDDSGHILRWYSVAIDIEEQSRAEDALRKSEARLAEAERELQLTLDSIPVAVTIFDADGSCISINKRAHVYTGVPSADDWQGTIHPGDVELAERTWRACIENGEPLENACRIRTADGTYRWCMRRRVPLRDDTGKVIRWYGIGYDIEDQKRAQEALRESEHSARLIVDGIPGLIVVYTSGGEFERVNRQVTEYFGRSLDDLLSKRWGTRDAIHPDDRPRATELFKQSMASGEPWDFEVRLRRFDGVYRWFRSRGSPLQDANGRIVRWYNLLIDIDERKRGEEALRQGEAQLADAKQELQLTIDTIPTLIASYWPNGDRDFVSKNWQEYTGISQEEARGKSSVITFHPDRRDAGEDMWRTCLASGEPYEADERLRRADGEYRWHWIRRVPLRDESGKIIKWYGVGHDIEHQKQAEAALLNSEARLTEAERELRLTLDSIPTITWRAGANGYVQQLNKRWFEYTGTTHEQARGWRWKLCVHPDDLDQLVNIGNKYVSSGESIDSEARLRRFDGEYRWFLFRPAPVRDESGSVVAWYGTITDIEDRKRAEQKALQAERELQRTIDNIPVLVGTYSADGTRLSVNKRALEVTGLPAADVPGGVWNTKTFHPDDVDAINAQWRECLARGEPFEREIRTRVADGTYRAHLTRRVPLRDEVGNLIRWYGVAHDIEDQRRAEQALAASERNLRLTIDTMPAVTWVAGADGSAEFVNQNYLNYVGLPVEQLMGWGWMAVVHPDDLTGLVATWQALLASGEAGETEARLRRHDGAFRWFLFRANPLHDENGSIVKWYGINTDIEDRKRAETLLAGEKQLFERIASGRPLREVLGSLCGLVEDAAADCHCAIHPIDWSGPKFEYGVAPSLPASYSEPIEGLPVSEELLPCGVAAHQNIQVVAEDIESDPRWQRSSVRIHTLEYGLRAVWSTPIHARDGRVLGTFCVLQRKPASPSPHHQNLIAHATQIASIAIERSRTEAALRRSEAFLAKGQEASSTGTFSFYSGTGEFTWSEQLYRIYEFEPGIPVTFELISTRYHPEDKGVIEGVAEQVRGGTTDFDYAHRLLMPDGSVKHVHVVAHGIPDKEGRGLEYFGAVQDVTQRRVAEEASEKVRSELTHLTRVMSLGALTASIAHEVNQPLAGIVTNASTCLRMLAANPPNVDGARETARRTIRDGNRAADVITRLRALFRKKIVATETVDLNEATREVVALVFGDLLRNRVSVRVELGEEPLLVSGDRVQLQQVILNLVRNASDAMSEVTDRPRDLLVKAEREEGGSARLSVKDAGVGLEPQAIERLFDAFYTTKSDGMGIGLSVSRSIIESHGGKMWAVPNQGPGATFSFSVPQQAESVGEQGIADAIQSGPTRGAHDVTRNA